MDYKHIVRQLNWYYYGIAALTVVIATLSYLIIYKDMVDSIDPFSTWGRHIQTLFIIITVSFIPLGLFIFNKRCQKIRLIEDDIERQQAYIKAAIKRIVIVGTPMVIDILAYYILGGNQSMLWMAAVGAIGWYMTKPTERKIQLELLPDDDSY